MKAMPALEIKTAFRCAGVNRMEFAITEVSMAQIYLMKIKVVLRILNLRSK